MLRSLVLFLGAELALVNAVECDSHIDANNNWTTASLTRNLFRACAKKDLTRAYAQTDYHHYQCYEELSTPFCDHHPLKEVCASPDPGNLGVIPADDTFLTELGELVDLLYQPDDGWLEDIPGGKTKWRNSWSDFVSVISNSNSLYLFWDAIDQYWRMFIDGVRDNGERVKDSSKPEPHLTCLVGEYVGARVTFLEDLALIREINFNVVPENQIMSVIEDYLTNFQASHDAMEKAGNSPISRAVHLAADLSPKPALFASPIFSECITLLAGPWSASTMYSRFPSEVWFVNETDNVRVKFAVGNLALTDHNDYPYSWKDGSQGWGYYTSSGNHWFLFSSPCNGTFQLSGNYHTSPGDGIPSSFTWKCPTSQTCSELAAGTPRPPTVQPWQDPMNYYQLDMSDKELRDLFSFGKYRSVRLPAGFSPKNVPISDIFLKWSRVLVKLKVYGHWGLRVSAADRPEIPNYPGFNPNAKATDLYEDLCQSLWLPFCSAENAIVAPLIIPQCRDDELYNQKSNTCIGLCSADPGRRQLTGCVCESSVCEDGVCRCDAAPNHPCCTSNEAACGQPENSVAECVGKFDGFCVETQFDVQCVEEAKDRCHLEC